MFRQKNGKKESNTILREGTLARKGGLKEL